MERKTKIVRLNKPSYHIPTMKEVRRVPMGGYSAISTFSGCGGSCLGYQMAGFNIIWANEMEPNAAETYRLNFPDSIVDQRDIRDIDPQEILQAINMKPGELDLLDGSPPCQSFSTAGKREKYWGKSIKHGDGTSQRSDDLFFEYTRLLKRIQPKVFIAENVSGLIKGVAKGYFKNILQELKSCGYIVEARLLDAQWLGVPQMRCRIIFIGIRRDLVDHYHIMPKFPQPFSYQYSVIDGIGDLINGMNKRQLIQNGTKPKSWKKNSYTSPAIMAGRSVNIRCIEDTKGAFSYGDFTKGPSPTVRSGGVGHLYVETDISKYAIAKEWDKLKPGEASEKYFNLVKPNARKPCPTVTAIGGSSPSIASVTHPSEKRKFTIAELKRICAFPDDFTLIGSYSQQWARLGNSVPPLMMKAIAQVVRDEMLAKIPRQK